MDQSNITCKLDPYICIQPPTPNYGPERVLVTYQQIQDCMEELQMRIANVQYRFNNSFSLPGYSHMTNFMAREIGMPNLCPIAVDEVDRWLPN